MLTGAATIFTVGDMTASLAYYQTALGFDVTFQYGEPSFYACLCRDDVALHLIAAYKTPRPPGSGAICIFVTDVDAIHAEFVSRGAKVLQAPQDYAYGMRDFNVADLDGNQINFGMATKQTP